LKGRTLSVFSILLILGAAVAVAQTDPGPRGGSPGAGGPLASVAANNPTTILNFFTDGQTRFGTIDGVIKNFFAGEGGGLGPRYNSRSCARCHAAPAVGGSSPATNPEFEDSTAHGAQNTFPSFLSVGGPVREVRFVYFTDAGGNPILSQPNGGVEPLFTIAGRPDANPCTTSNISQPDFATNWSHNNIIFRIPTPLFGSGLIENIEETTLMKNVGGNPFGISGTLNRNPNDGTITRFGWKAQNKSLEIFAGEAYNVEQGVSNELFTQERPTPEEEKALGLPDICKLNATPEDHTNFNTTAVATPSDTVAFAMFMRLLAPPQPTTSMPSQLHGQTVFIDIGCDSCHHQTFTTSPSAFTTDLGNARANLYSDLELHHMGTGLADNVVQGNAGGDQFRTAPLWGIGQRLWFLHDGRTNNLLTAITAHQSTNSEANSVILNFNALSVSDKQDVINFLRSL
jgi:CxxC motif-containing protein (DUF1111 family)